MSYSFVENDVSHPGKAAEIFASIQSGVSHINGAMIDAQLIATDGNDTIFVVSASQPLTTQVIGGVGFSIFTLFFTGGSFAGVSAPIVTGTDTLTRFTAIPVTQGFKIYYATTTTGVSDATFHFTTSPTTIGPASDEASTPPDIVDAIVSPVLCRAFHFPLSGVPLAMLVGHGNMAVLARRAASTEWVGIYTQPCDIPVPVITPLPGDWSSQKNPGVMPAISFFDGFGITFTGKAAPVGSISFESGVTSVADAIAPSVPSGGFYSDVIQSHGAEYLIVTENYAQPGFHASDASVSYDGSTIFVMYSNVTSGGDDEDSIPQDLIVTVFRNSYLQDLQPGGTTGFLPTIQVKHSPSTMRAATSSVPVCWFSSSMVESDRSIEMTTIGAITLTGAVVNVIVLTLVLNPQSAIIQYTSNQPLPAYHSSQIMMPMWGVHSTVTLNTTRNFWTTTANYPWVITLAPAPSPNLPNSILFMIGAFSQSTASNPAILTGDSVAYAHSCWIVPWFLTGGQTPPLPAPITVPYQ